MEASSAFWGRSRILTLQPPWKQKTLRVWRQCWSPRCFPISWVVGRTFPKSSLSLEASGRAGRWSRPSWWRRRGPARRSPEEWWERGTCSCRTCFQQPLLMSLVLVYFFEFSILDLFTSLLRFDLTFLKHPQILLYSLKLRYEFSQIF